MIVADIENFEELLESAELNAVEAWDMDFLESLMLEWSELFSIKSAIPMNFWKTGKPRLPNAA